MSEIRNIWLHAHRMLRLGRRMINENLAPLHLSSAEGNILLHLLTQGGEMGQEQLVEELDISKPGVSRALSLLEEKGFVKRHPSPDDLRARRVRLTEKAREGGPTIEQAYNHVYALAVEGISEEELAHFLTLFGRLSENFVAALAAEKSVEAQYAG